MTWANRYFRSKYIILTLVSNWMRSQEPGDSGGHLKTAPPLTTPGWPESASGAPTRSLQKKLFHSCIYLFWCSILYSEVSRLYSWKSWFEFWPNCPLSTLDLHFSHAKNRILFFKLGMEIIARVLVNSWVQTHETHKSYQVLLMLGRALLWNLFIFADFVEVRIRRRGGENIWSTRG